jgi:hypothetical protein
MSVYSSLSGISVPASSSASTATATSILTLSGNQIQIGDLDFGDIKTSIIEYLKRTESPLKDFDFESSAIQVLVDALAYNTLYYAFYSNMIANELYLDSAQRIESLISISKPLGFEVPAGASSRASVSMANVTGTIPKYSRFVGTTPDGANYNFFTLNSYDPDTTGNINEVVLFEAKDFVLNRNVTSQIDIDRQRLILNDDRIDLNSLIIEVSEDNGETFTEYTRISNISYDITEESKVYFTERQSRSVRITFSARGNEEFSSLNRSLETDNVGRKILNTDIVRISYLLPTGPSANGIRSFTYASGTGTPTLRVASFGGSLEPDSDLIKFFAPKWFAAQGRAVTKNDYRAAIPEFFPAGQSPDESLVVFGGEETDPPYYGRVFISTIDGAAGGVIDANSVAITEKLRELCPVSIVPEYLAPQNLTMNLSYNVNYNGSGTTRTREQVERAIFDAIADEYGKVRFNNSVDVSDLVALIKRVEPAVITPLNISFDVSRSEILSTDRDVEFTFKNAINFAGAGNGLTSTTFTSPKFGLSNVFIQDSGVTPNRFGVSPLRLVTRDSSGLISVAAPSGVGEIDYNRGLVRIFKNVANSSVVFTANFKDPKVIAKQEIILRVLQGSVTVNQL